MSKHRTTVFIEQDMLNAIRKVAKADERPMAYHHDKALRAYGPIKKLLAKVDAPLTRVPAIAKGFAKPSIVELASYFHEIGSLTCNDDANSFFDHFESNGWLISGRAKMKCWKAAARNWNKNKAKFAPKGKETEGEFMAKHTATDWND
jgi:hypothetical protein